VDPSRSTIHGGTQFPPEATQEEGGICDSFRVVLLVVFLGLG